MLLAFVYLTDAMFVYFMLGCNILVITLSIYEWGRLSNFTTTSQLLTYIVCLWALIAAIVAFKPEIAYPFLLFIAILWVIISAIFMTKFSIAKAMWSKPEVRILLGIVTIAPVPVAFYWILQLPDIKLIVMYLFIIVSSNDIGAFFVGKAIGRRKLAPQISPNKTLEGALGGIFISTLMAIAFAFLISAFDKYDWLLFIILSVFLNITAIFGDLWESTIKRLAKVKDSGNILPGHGGIMDRFDSTIALIPALALILYWPK